VSEAAARQLGVEGFVALWRGERVTVTDLCDDPMVIDAQVRSGRLEVDDAGVVVGVHGLTARPTRHRIECGRAQRQQRHHRRGRRGAAAGLPTGSGTDGS